MKNRYLFFFVHPSKFHVFRHTINCLKQRGYTVDILITSKDVLEQLVQLEGWPYTNIFPEGRKFKKMPGYVGTGINFFRTIYRLWRYTRRKKYDLYITDDLLVYLGKLNRTPCIAFTDDDIAVTRAFSLVLSQADRIMAPTITNLGRFNAKKIPFEGYKELAYLHPEIFTPDLEVIRKFNPTLERYFIIRLVSLTAYHDTGMRGLTDENTQLLIQLLSQYGRVFISNERQLSPDLEPYRLHIDPRQVVHALYYADLFIGDSQTMTSEAAVLGTPAIRYSDFVGRISVMDEKVERYRLSYSYSTHQFEDMLVCIKKLLDMVDLKGQFAKKRSVMLSEKVNLSAFMLHVFENPEQYLCS